MSTIVVKGRSVGKSTDLANGHCDIEKYGITEEEATRARIEFIQTFPALAPLMYSLEVEEQPDSVEAWLRLMRQEVNKAHKDHVSSLFKKVGFSDFSVPTR